MGRIGSCIPRQFMSVALAPHCWNDTSLADPEYEMDFRSPIAFCAVAITVFASCAIAFPHRNATQIATTLSFFNTASPPPLPYGKARLIIVVTMMVFANANSINVPRSAVFGLCRVDLSWPEADGTQGGGS